MVRKKGVCENCKKKNGILRGVEQGDCAIYFCEDCLKKEQGEDL